MTSASSVVSTFATPRITMDRRDDGSMILRSEEPLAECARSVGHAFTQRAKTHPDRVLVSEPAAAGTGTTLTYGEALSRGRAVAQSLLDIGADQHRPVMVLSGNSIDHLVVSLGAYLAGVPVIPVSVAYSLSSKDHERVRAIAALTTPAVVFADDADRFGEALDAVAAPSRVSLVSRGSRPGAMRLDQWTSATVTDAVDVALDRVGPDSVAKLLFTSGSTGRPKGVINTNRMLCSNQAMLAQVWPFMAEEPPVLVDWLPWSHTFGGNHNLNLVLFNGGTMHIDDGKPIPALFERTISALREVSPTAYFNVPAGWALLVSHLEQDRDFAQHFFSRLRFMFYAAAALPDAVALRLRAAAQAADCDVPLTSSWGTTETAPCVTTSHFATAVVGCMGVPLPGVAVKLMPEGEKLEARVQGPNVTPGYIGDSASTAVAFDEEGFYMTG